MRFIHTADLHLGACPDSGLPWAAERKQALWDAFHTIIRAVREEGIDLLLIAGDFFHRRPLLRELREVNSLFKSIAPAQVVIIAGNHDCLQPSSPYASFPWAVNVHFLSSGTMDSAVLPELNTVVHGFSYHRPIIRDALYDHLSVPQDGMYHILLAHGGDDTHIPIRLNALAKAGFDYVALGHIHQPRLFSKAGIAWCGSPEPLDRTDIGRRGYIRGEIGAAGCHFRWVPCAIAEYKPVTVTVTPSSTSLQIRQMLESRLDPDPRYLYLIRLTGSREPDMVFEKETIRQAGRIVDVIDETQPAYDLDRLEEEHSHDLVARFIRELNRPDAGDLEKKALFYGLQALLPPDA